jgi:hypothetical protein
VRRHDPVVKTIYDFTETMRVELSESVTSALDHNPNTDMYDDLYKHPAWKFLSQSKSIDQFLQGCIRKQFEKTGAERLTKGNTTKAQTYSIATSAIVSETSKRLPFVMQLDDMLKNLKTGDLDKFRGEEDLPLASIGKIIHDKTRELETLVKLSRYLDRVKQMEETRSEIFFLLDALVAKLSAILDVYVVGRLLKPYVSTAVVLQGYAHTYQQLPALLQLGFQIEFESPVGSSHALQPLEPEVEIKDFVNTIIPREIYYSDWHIGNVLEDNKPLSYFIVYRDPKTGLLVASPFHSFPQYPIKQCIDITDFVI